MPSATARLFRFSGRIPRSAFWLGAIALGCAFVALVVPVAGLEHVYVF
jgi:uncharacterized membrane protein YhaH (DUF805 family)